MCAFAGDGVPFVQTVRFPKNIHLSRRADEVLVKVCPKGEYGTTGPFSSAACKDIPKGICRHLRFLTQFFYVP